MVLRFPDGSLERAFLRQPGARHSAAQKSRLSCVLAAMEISSSLRASTFSNSGVPYSSSSAEMEKRLPDG
jgi:hypothetical protein